MAAGSSRQCFSRASAVKVIPARRKTGSRLDSSAQREAMICQGQTQRKKRAHRPKAGPLALLASSQNRISATHPPSAFVRRRENSERPKSAINGMER